MGLIAAPRTTLHEAAAGAFPRGLSPILNSALLVIGTTRSERREGRWLAMLSDAAMRSLALVRYLHAQAIEQERKGDLLAGLALLPFRQRPSPGPTQAHRGDRVSVFSRERCADSRRAAYRLGAG